MFISPSCLFDDMEFTTSSPGFHHGTREFITYALADSAHRAHREATVYATAGTKCLASVTEATTFELADGIASGMPTSESAIPIRVDP
jgi:hypothetical protein